jgi:hypothetical protein
MIVMQPKMWVREKVTNRIYFSGMHAAHKQKNPWIRLKL